MSDQEMIQRLNNAVADLVESGEDHETIRSVVEEAISNYSSEPLEAGIARCGHVPTASGSPLSCGLEAGHRGGHSENLTRTAQAVWPTHGCPPGSGWTWDPSGALVSKW